MPWVLVLLSSQGHSIIDYRPTPQGLESSIALAQFILRTIYSKGRNEFLGPVDDSKYTAR